MASTTRAFALGLTLPILLAIALPRSSSAQVAQPVMRFDLRTSWPVSDIWDVGLRQRLQTAPTWSAAGPGTGLVEIDPVGDDWDDDDWGDDDGDDGSGAVAGGGTGDWDDDEEDDDVQRGAARVPSPPAGDRTLRLAARTQTAVRLSGRLAGGWRMAASYEYGVRPGANAHALAASVEHRHQVAGSPVELRTRLRLQQQLRGGATRTYARLRAVVRGRSRLAPYAGVEVFYRIADEASAWRRARGLVGARYPLAGRHGLTAEYVLQRRLGASPARLEGAVTLGYVWTL